MKLLSIFASTILLSLFLQGCSTSRHVPPEIVDTYYGFFPCADCPGISYALVLQKNGRYSLTMDYFDRESTFESEGKFIYKNNNLNLYTDGKISGRYEVENNKLIYLDADGNRINSPLASHYILYKGAPSRADMPKDFGKNNNGLIFKGTGNEPFWSVEISEDHNLKFNGLMEGIKEFEIPVTDIHLSRDNQFIIYSGKEESNVIEIRIINEKCQDDMSGHYFNSKLEVDLTSGDQKKQLKGCGEFLNKYRLNGMWQLEKTNDQPQIQNEVTLAIYLPEGRISGNAGCNRYFGSVENVTDQSIQFDKTGATKMACPDMSLENKYLSFLQDKHIEWMIDKKGRLHLKNGSENFIFHRSFHSDD